MPIVFSWTVRPRGVLRCSGGSGAIEFVALTAAFFTAFGSVPVSRLCHGCSALSSSLRSTDALSNSAVKFDLACSLLVPYMPLALVSLTLVAFATRVAGFKKEHQSTASSHHNHPRLNSWRWAAAKRVFKTLIWACFIMLEGQCEIYAVERPVLC